MHAVQPEEDDESYQHESRDHDQHQQDDVLHDVRPN